MSEGVHGSPQLFVHGALGDRVERGVELTKELGRGLVPSGVDLDPERSEEPHDCEGDPAAEEEHHDDDELCNGDEKATSNERSEE